MQFGQRTRVWWGLAASAAVHALLLGAVLLATRRTPEAPAAPGALLQVSLVAARPAPAAVAAASAVQATAAAAAAAFPKREAIRYFSPDEVERQLIVLRDPAADQAIALPHPVVLELFVDRHGRVAAIVIARQLAPRLEAQVRAAFMQLEFLPALRGGKEVPAYLRIELAAEN